MVISKGHSEREKYSFRVSEMADLECAILFGFRLGAIASTEFRFTHLPIVSPQADALAASAHGAMSFAFLI